VILRFYHRRRDEGDTEGRDHYVDDHHTTDHYRLTAFPLHSPRPRHPIRTDHRRPSRFTDETRMMRTSLNVWIINSRMRPGQVSEIYMGRTWGNKRCIQELIVKEKGNLDSRGLPLLSFFFLYYVIILFYYILLFSGLMIDQF